MVKAANKISEDYTSNTPVVEVEAENTDEIDMTVVDDVLTQKRFPCLAHCIQLVIRSLDKFL